MNGELFGGFEREIVTLKEKIITARADLEGIEDNEAAATARFELRVYQNLLAAVIRARDAVIGAESEAEQMPIKFRKWRANVLAVREARSAVEDAEKPIPDAQFQLDVARQNFQNAQSALSDHRSARRAARDACPLRANERKADAILVGVRTRYLLLPSCRVPAHAFGSYFPQPGNEVGVRPSGPSRVDSRVELCGGLQILVAEELPNQFVRPRVRVEVDFRREMPELVRSELDTDMPEHAPLDRYPDS